MEETLTVKNCLFCNLEYTGPGYACGQTVCRLPWVVDTPVLVLSRDGGQFALWTERVYGTWRPPRNVSRIRHVNASRGYRRFLLVKTGTWYRLPWAHEFIRNAAARQIWVYTLAPELQAALGDHFVR